MTPGEVETIANPFAGPLRNQRRGIRSAFVSAFKLVALACVAFAGVLAVQHYSRVWLVHRYTQDLNQLPTDQRIARLLELSTLGGPDRNDAAMPTIVAALTDPEPPFAQAAWRILQQAQDDWALLSPSRSDQKHRQLIRLIGQQADRVPADRTAWAAGLVQTSLDALRRSGKDDDLQINRLALNTLQRLNESGASATVTGDGDTTVEGKITPTAAAPTPLRIVGMSAPLPIGNDWAGNVDDAAPNSVAANTDEAANQPAQASARPIQAQDDTNLQAVAPETVHLKPVGDTPQIVAVAKATPPTSAVQTTSHLVQSPLEAMDIRTVVQFLADPAPETHDLAEAELRRRQWSDSKIELADRLVSGSVSARLELIDWLGSQSKFDPRAWLLLLLDDTDARIRHRVVSVLKTVNDPDVQDRLRKHAASESAPEIRSLILQ
ncbi:HEAT repeat domain-containing protein [Crateriforma spongiae]|uniref:HEAT repeat domain-containing protein n=1 Tax=Crateriforma spongiae TaxID=2724528 RepID=UPI0014487329|nr:HEAT repeat domain-containing protein [Crateriforma spongiae]